MVGKLIHHINYPPRVVRTVREGYKKERSQRPHCFSSSEIPLAILSTFSLVCKSRPFSPTPTELSGFPIGLLLRNCISACHVNV